MRISMLRSPLLLVPSAWIAFAVFANMRAEPPRVCPTGCAVASCASAGCHGGGEAGKPFSEVTTWASGDPHFRAFSVLYSDESRRIMKNLHWEGEAFHDQRCLDCHTANGTVCFDEYNTNAHTDGVGCDACHGGSRPWLTKHYEPGWNKATEKSFVNNKDLVTRISNCAGCHVGDAKRTVNHDLIAAGHPRLAFEYTRFHYLPEYKKHWTEKLPEREFEIRAWFIGQVASLKLAVERTQAWHAKGPKPELSEQSCFACHQPLKGVPREKLEVKPAWQPWHTATIQLLAGFTPAVFPGASEPKLTALMDFEKGMESYHLRSAPEAIAELNRWLEDLRKVEQVTPKRGLPTHELLKMAHAIAKSGVKVDDWDLACNHYLALAALHHADSATLSPITDLLESLKHQLRYRKNGTSPAEYSPSKSSAIFKAIADTLTPRESP